jgi:arylsulfatase A-like enzyme/tetratricopeptide (TPR) repeat protein
VLALAAIAALLTSSCVRRPERFPGSPVILISIDTLRADHLPAYGYSAVETPNLDALARDSVVFEEAFSQVPLTLPSHVSLLTGQLPFRTGVRDNVGYRLGAEPATLAQELGRKNYVTGAAVSAFVLDHGTGIARGFDFYEDSIELTRVGEVLGRIRRPGEHTEKLLEDWIGRQDAARPLFAFLHLYEPHAPYAPPEPFKSRYASQPYDGAIAQADAITGRFLEFLKRRRLYERSLIVFLSDHGEGLGDHGEDEHGIFLYREDLRVPLFLKLPGQKLAGRRFREPAALVDVSPTILSIVAQAPLGSAGIPLVSGENRAGRRIYSETLYPRYHFGWSDLASLTGDRYQYIHAPRPELYDWKADPAEKRNLASGAPAPFRSMRAEIQGMDRPLQGPGPSDPETLRKFAALGYLGTAAPPSGTEALPDPKEKIGSVDVLKDANRLLASHREAEAIALLQKLGNENPRMLDVWESLSNALRRTGRPKEAAEALARADRLQPGTPQILLGLADLSLASGDLQKARGFAEAAGAAGARDAALELGTIALAAGDLKTAREEAALAAQASPASRGPRVLLAEIEIRAGRPEVALAEVAKCSLEPPLMNLQTVRGDAFARLGRAEEAIGAFQSEIANFPENLYAWSKLAFVYAGSGRKEDFHRTLSEMVAKNPSAHAYALAGQLAKVVGDSAEEKRWELRE